MTLPNRKHNIEWSQLSWNFQTGCDGPKSEDHRCTFCYAWRRAIAMKGRFGYPEDDPFKPIDHPDKLSMPLKRKKPAVWFYCSMGDWLCDGMDYEWTQAALKVMAEAKQHIFVTLTKQYENLGLIETLSPYNRIPRNVVVGITVTKPSQAWGIKELLKVDARVRLVCAEPLLENLYPIDLKGIDWLIIGAQTRQPAIAGLPQVNRFRPDRAWVQKLVYTAKMETRPPVLVFLKPNLNYLAGWYDEKMEEFPFEKLGWKQP